MFAYDLIAEEVDTTEQLKSKIGFGFNYHLNYHIANFGKLPDYPSCCGNYASHWTSGFSIHTLFDYPINNQSYINFRLSYSDNRQIFKNIENTTVIINGISQDGKFEHNLNSRFADLSFLSYYSYIPYDFFNFHFGTGLKYIIDGSFSQNEKIIEPKTTGTFPDGTRIRNNYDGKINNLQNLQILLSIGISYELPLIANRTYTLYPELFYNYYPMNLVKGLKWNYHSIRLGVSLKYKEPPPPPLPPPAPISPPYPELELPKKPPLITASIKAVEKKDEFSQEKADFQIKIEEFISLNLRPLLMYIFFEENSAVIPDRYKKLTASETYSFNFSQLNNLDPLETYYHILNIIGKRMRDNPKSTISLVGTNSNKGQEKNNLTLSLNRALAVKNYLVEIWKIESSRIRTSARNLPQAPTISDEEGADEENRRVEITSDDDTIEQAVISNDTLRQLSSTTIRFYTKVISEAEIENWSLIARQDNTILYKKEGQSLPPTYFEWIINDTILNNKINPGVIKYTFSITNKFGQTFTTIPQIIPVEQLTIPRKKLERIEDKEFEQYSLILFDYGKAKLSKSHFTILNFIKSRLNPNSEIYIYGYTDAIGDEDINYKLSLARAKEVAKALRATNAKIEGIGESRILYDTKFPEGRFYCRTVKIDIITKIIDNGK